MMQLGRSFSLVTKGALRNRFRAEYMYKAAYRYTSTLVLAEQPSERFPLSNATRSAITAAKAFSYPITVFVNGEGSERAAEELRFLADVDKVIIAPGKTFKHSPADVCADALAKLVREEQHTVLMGPVCSSVRDILARCSALLDIQAITDVISIKSNNIFVRPIYAGNAIATVQSLDSIKALTIRPTAFSSELPTLDTAKASVQTFESEDVEPQIRWIRDIIQQSEKPQISSAKVIVSGGRGLKNAENFQALLTPLCEKLNAALGASRAAVDAGFVSNDLQIGQTGKVVAPELYIAVGISGAIQHLAGMKESKVIVAINKDGDAPIFQVADYGLVGDLFEIIPNLTAQLSPK
ncbi:electron-transfer-flavoprotein, alpha polypeptide [Cardiosporidium cionae]|uniref:Electron transfer flavoprotein subunit alpha n=1 Tax=Cardiosporidium cionae TaxID=476202 RepID=A0ABQ7J8F7_9APIC|nr:electron-transfer-flavoprotein, alpha polypeptide [Cardiosporidium cionae]|eukprot:KAF8820257.1 electron-transfer-flavoprotein, alpha polypeptide [Cardiosporidium cionae]